jgi:hypothetical protein
VLCVSDEHHLQNSFRFPPTAEIIPKADIQGGNKKSSHPLTVPQIPNSLPECQEKERKKKREREWKT